MRDDRVFVLAGESNLMLCLSAFSPSSIRIGLDYPGSLLVTTYQGQFRTLFLISNH